MPSVSFYFQVHQPYRLKKYTIFDAEHDQHYFDEQKNREIMQKVAHKCYLPTNKLLLEMIHQYHGKFRVAFSLTGTAIEQFAKYAPEVLASFRQLALTGCVEFMAETYAHSISSLFDEAEFSAQIKKHNELMLDHFDYQPVTFRNTELLYANRVAALVGNLGYKAVLAEGAEHLLGWRSPNFVYTPAGSPQVKLLLRNGKLSDDISYRFSNKVWAEYPLTAAKYASWISQVNGAGDVVNVFMDYETFGEHHAKESGIMDFLKHVPGEILKNADNSFLLPREVAEKYASVGEIDCPAYTSWADSQKDASAWLGNNMQHDAARAMYQLLKDVRQAHNKHLLEDWRKLSAADHLYYISTKGLSDGDVHKYFSPYKTPYDAFINLMNVLENMRKRLSTHVVQAKEKHTGVAASRKAAVKKPVPVKVAKVKAKPKAKPVAVKKTKPVVKKNKPTKTAKPVKKLAVKRTKQTVKKK